MVSDAPEATTMGRASRVRPSLVIVALALAAEAAARLSGGYVLGSLPLVRIDERAATERTEIAPLAWREGHFGASRQIETWRERQKTLQWDQPPRAPEPFEWIGIGPKGAADTSPPLRYPPSSLLPGGMRTDPHGWRTTGDEAEDGAVKVAFIGSDFTFGEDDISLPGLVQAELDRKAGPARASKFRVYNLAREGLDQEDFASVVTEAAAIRPDIVVIENVAPFAAPSTFVESSDHGKRAKKLRAREETWAFYDAILQQPRHLSALYDSWIAPLRPKISKYKWTFDDASSRAAEQKKRNQIEAALAAAEQIGAKAIVVGGRSAVRPGQTFPRDRRLMRLNWNRAYGFIKPQDAYEIYAADADLVRSAAAQAGAAYVELSAVAGRPRYFDDDLTLSQSGYRRVAARLAVQIVNAREPSHKR